MPSHELGLSRKEVIADAVVHGLGIAAALIGVGALLREGIISSAPLAILAVYGFGLIAMLGCSAAYNLFLDLKCRELLRRLDFAAIFFMVAANYTPFTTEVLPGPWAFGLTAAVWAIALGGIAYKVFVAPYGGQAQTTVLLLAFGWIGVVAAKPMIAALDPDILWMIVAGGLLYSVGAVFFSIAGLPFRRAIWHSFVVAGAAVHFGAVFLLVASPT